MRGLRGPGRAETPLAAERRRVLAAIAAIEGSDPTGSAISRRIDARSAEPTAGAERLLYPALHSLEATWQIHATWLPAPDGSVHRTYRRRRLLPWRFPRPEGR